MARGKRIVGLEAGFEEIILKEGKALVIQDIKDKTKNGLVVGYKDLAKALAGAVRLDEEKTEKIIFQDMHPVLCEKTNKGEWILPAPIKLAKSLSDHSQEIIGVEIK